jgi:hypothetical protein
VHVLALSELASIARRLRAVGFRVRIVRGYGRLRFKPGQVGFVARKPLE